RLTRRAGRGAAPAGPPATPNANDPLFYNLDDSVPGKANVAALAADILRSGSAVLREPIVHVAFGSSWNRTHARALRDAAMAADLDEETIAEIPHALAGSVEIPTPPFPTAKWPALLAYRQRFGEARSDLAIMRKLFQRVSSDDDPWITRLLALWRSQPAARRSPPVQALLTALDAGIDR